MPPRRELCAAREKALRVVNAQGLFLSDDAQAVLIGRGQGWPNYSA